MVTPRQIEEKCFKMSLRGYNTDEVDEFLQEICDSYEKIYGMNCDLKEKTGRLSDAVGQYKSMEDTLNNALNIADKSVGEIEDAAQKRAAEIIQNAHLEARAIIKGAEQKAEEEIKRFESIRKEVEVYKEKITDLLNAQLSVLNGYPSAARTNKEMPFNKEWVKPKKSFKDDFVHNITDTIVISSNKKDDKEAIKESQTVNKRNNGNDITDPNMCDTDVINTTVINTVKEDLAAENDLNEASKKSDTEKLPFVTSDENGGYVVHNR